MTIQPFVVKRPVVFVVAFLLGLAASLLALSLRSGYWIASRRAPDSHVGLWTVCAGGPNNKAAEVLGGPCAQMDLDDATAFLDVMGVKRPEAQASLLVASQALVVVSTLFALGGWAGAAHLALRKGESRLMHLALLVPPLVAFVCSLLSVIFMGNLAMAFKTGLLAITYPAARPSSGWDLALSGCIFAGLALITAITDVMLLFVPQASAGVKRMQASLAATSPTGGAGVGPGAQRTGEPTAEPGAEHDRKAR